MKNCIQNTKNKKTTENSVTTKIRAHLAKLLIPDYTPPDYIREEVARLQEAAEKERAKSDRERESDSLNFLLVFFVVIPLCFSLLVLLVGLASC